jgi:hypothetical protein
VRVDVVRSFHSSQHPASFLEFLYYVCAVHGVYHTHRRELCKIYPECPANTKVASAESLRYAELGAIASWLEREGVCLPLPIRRLKPARYERAARPTRSWLLLAAYAALWSIDKRRGSNFYN